MLELLWAPTLVEKFLRFSMRLPAGASVESDSSWEADTRAPDKFQ